MKYTDRTGSDLPAVLLPGPSLCRDHILAPEAASGATLRGAEIPVAQARPAGLPDQVTQGSQETTLFGYRISNCGLQGDVAKACRFIASGLKTGVMACANPHSLVVAGSDKVFSRALHDADILIPDGTGIVVAAKAFDLPILHRVAGSEFFQGLTGQLAAEGGARYFFLGSSEQALKLITERMNREYPEITVCGTLSPPFKEEFSPEDDAAMAAAVKAARPDVLWVGMTAPKQEKWIYLNRAQLEVPFVAAVGAVFDFYAGTKKRPSIFWQRIGMEWFPRFLREPRRLWERNLRSTPIFLYWIFRGRVKNLLFPATQGTSPVNNSRSAGRAPGSDVNAALRNEA